MECVHTALAYSSTYRIAYDRMNIHVVGRDTVTTVRSGYCVGYRTTGSDMLSVEVKVFSFAYMFVQSNTNLRIDGQIEVRDRVATVYRC